MIATLLVVYFATYSFDVKGERLETPNKVINKFSSVFQILQRKSRNN